jgi:hypothetical protein
MSAHDLAWAAGLFEGEGSISPRKTAAPHLWQLALTSTDEDVVRTFCEVIGSGRVYGPYGYVNGTSRRRDHHKPYWRWSVSDQLGIEAVAGLLRPYLFERRRARLDECLEAVAKTPFTRAVHKRRPKVDN